MNETEWNKWLNYVKKQKIAAASNDTLNQREGLVPEHRLDMHLIKLRLIQKEELDLIERFAVWMIKKFKYKENAIVV